MAAHREAKDLIEIGAYVPGSNAEVDRAVALQDDIRAFLTQDIEDTVPAAESWGALGRLVGAQ
jgi:flagellum-specific ATP synthase